MQFELLGCPSNVATRPVLIKQPSVPDSLGKWVANIQMHNVSYPLFLWIVQDKPCGSFIGIK